MRIKESQLRGNPHPIWVLIVLLLSCCGPLKAEAEVVRVAMFDLQSSGGRETNGTAAEAVARRAAWLKQSRPDVILLSGAPDWQGCEAIVQALKPESYALIVCSAFAFTGEQRQHPGQLAILSRRKAALTWSEPWRSSSGDTINGGFVFAVIPGQKHRLGVFVVRSGGVSLETAAQQWAEAVSGLRDWVTNRIEAAVVGVAAAKQGTSDLEFQTVLTQPFSGFAIAEPDESGRVTAKIPADADRLPGIFCGREAVVELDLDDANRVILVADRKYSDAATLIGREADSLSPKLAFGARLSGMTRNLRDVSTRDMLVAVSGSLLLGLVVLLAGRRLMLRKSLPIKQNEVNPPTRPDVVRSQLGSEQVVAGQGMDDGVIPPAVRIEYSAASRTCSQTTPAGPQPESIQTTVSRPGPSGAGETREAGFIARVAGRLKDALVKLAVDRAVLMENQDAAASKVQAVDQRLADIELAVRERNRAYEQRIEQLQHELVTAKQQSGPIGAPVERSMGGSGEVRSQ